MVEEVINRPLKMKIMKRLNDADLSCAVPLIHRFFFIKYIP